jgi:serine protease inhibitor
MYFLLKALAPGRENLVFAPFGLATNIAMLLEAANGDTAKEILKAANISPKSIPDLRTGFKAYCDTFEVSDCIKQTFSSCESPTFSNLDLWSLC